MKTLIIELKKEKRTGIILLMPTLGLLGGAYAYSISLSEKIPC